MINLHGLDPRIRLAVEAALAAFAVGALDALLTAVAGGNWDPWGLARAALVGGLVALRNLYRHKPGSEPPKPQDPPKA